MSGRTMLGGAPNITQGVRRIIRDISRKLPELAHVNAARVLVVAGEARRRSRATIRPLAFATTRERRSSTGLRRKPVVRFRGRRVLYIITLRPMFFQESTPEQRVETILHELFHISKRFDGTLHSGRRHERLGERFEQRLRPLVRRYLEVIPSKHMALLSHDGIVAARQWLERPGRSYSMSKARDRKEPCRRAYDERHTFLGPVLMITRPSSN